MDKLTEISLKELGNIDSILSTATDESLKKKTADKISKNFDTLFSSVDTELKQNDELNKNINTLVEMKKVLTYDVKNRFMEDNYFYYGGEDVYTGSTFNEEEYEFARNFVQTWETDKKELETKINELKSSSFKLLFNGLISRYEKRLQEGNQRFESYSKIFEEEKVMKSVDKTKLENDFKQILESVNLTIDSTIDKHIIDTIKNNPSIVCFDVFCKKGKGYSFISTSENSTELNKNLYKYFDSSKINEKLSKILKAYNKQKLNESNSLENVEPSME